MEPIVFSTSRRKKSSVCTLDFGQLDFLKSNPTSTRVSDNQNYWSFNSRWNL